MKRIYLACPYSSDDDTVIEARVIAADKKAAELMEQGYIVFSPLSHSHRIARHIESHDHDFWMYQDLTFIDWCDEVLVLKLDGYEQSRGIKVEIDYAAGLGKPVGYLEAT